MRGLVVIVILNFMVGLVAIAPSASAIQSCTYPASLVPGVIVGSLNFGESNYYVNVNAFDQVVEITTFGAPFINGQVLSTACATSWFNCTVVPPVTSCYVPAGWALWLQNNFAGLAQYGGVSLGS